MKGGGLSVVGRGRNIKREGVRVHTLTPKDTHRYKPECGCEFCRGYEEGMLEFERRKAKELLNE